MSLPKYNDLSNLTTITDIDQEIFLLQKNIIIFFNFVILFI